MGWKNWSYIKKGGLIGAIIGLLIALYLFTFACSFMYPTLGSRKCNNSIEAVVSFIFFIISIPVMFLNFLPDILSGIVWVIYYIAIFWLLGLLIGWIIGKIKFS